MSDWLAMITRVEVGFLGFCLLGWLPLHLYWILSGFLQASLFANFSSLSLATGVYLLHYGGMTFD